MNDLYAILKEILRAAAHHEGKRKKMKTDDNKMFIRRYFEEAFNSGELTRFDRFFAPAFVDHDGFAGQAPGPEGVKAAYSMWRAAFPDTHVTLEEIIAEGDKVVVVTTLRATHMGPFMHIPATKKRVAVRGISVFRIAKGQIVERWGLTDAAGLLRQLRA